MLDLTSLESELLAAAAALGATVTIWKLGVKPLIKAIRNARSALTRADAAYTTLLEIHSEFSPNGGGSLKDQVTRIEANQMRLMAAHKVFASGLGIGSFEADANGRCTYVSREWSKLTGVHPDDALGIGWLISVHEADRGAVADRWLTAIKNAQDFQMDYRIGPDGRAVHGAATAVRDKTGQIIGWVGTVTPLED